LVINIVQALQFHGKCIVLKLARITLQDSGYPASFHGVNQLRREADNSHLRSPYILGRYASFLTRSILRDTPVKSRNLFHYPSNLVQRTACLHSLNSAKRLQ
jgi:hypothetical protein